MKNLIPDVNYFALCTGYTSRLKTKDVMDKFGRIDDDKINIRVLGIGDSVWGDGFHIRFLAELNLTPTEVAALDGSILIHFIEKQSLYDILEFTEKLRELDYCCISGVTQIYLSDNDKVLFVHYDAESG